MVNRSIAVGTTGQNDLNNINVVAAGKYQVASGVVVQTSESIRRVFNVHT